MITATSNPSHIYLFNKATMAELHDQCRHPTTVKASKGDGGGTTIENTPQEFSIFWFGNQMAVMDPRGFTIQLSSKETETAKAFLESRNKFKSHMVWMMVNKKLSLVPHDTLVEKPGTAPKIPMVQVGKMQPGTVYTTPHNEMISSSVFLGKLYQMPIWLFLNNYRSPNLANIAVDTYVDGSYLYTNPYHEGLITGSTDPAPLLLGIENKISTSGIYSSSSSKVPKISLVKVISTRCEIESEMKNQQSLLKFIASDGNEAWLHMNKVQNYASGRWGEFYNQKINYDSLVSIGATSAEVYSVG